MTVINLSSFDLILTALLLLLVLAISISLRLYLTKQLITASLRLVVQLTLIGLILHSLFTHIHVFWIALLTLVMVLVATREVVVRQRYRYSGYYSYGFSFLALLLSNLLVVLYALLIIIRVHPWYHPQYVIPLLGMLIGNALSGITISLDHLTQTAYQQSAMIEQQLMLGYPAKTAIAGIVHDSLKKGMIPTLNAMAVAGIVSLPGMMTGQILAGISPIIAVKYQIMILLLICVSTTLAILIAVKLSAKRLFDSRERLRLERLTKSP